MNADRLLAHYEQIADAPDAIGRLRRFVLDLAVRGKLVPQDDGDEPASKLLKRIAEETARLVKAGTFREPSSFVKIDSNDLPFEAASHWSWARLIDIARPSYGFAFASEKFNSAKRGMPLIRIRDISSTDTEAYFEGDYDPAYLVTNGDYLVGMDGDFNLHRWQGVDSLLNQRVMRINGWRCGINPEFIKLPLQFILNHLHELTSLTTVKHLSAKQVNGIEVPLPPLGEQNRIVMKVDELMGLCDRLKVARSGREAVRNRLAATSLARLGGPDPETFEADARFALNALTAITTRPEQIKTVRQTILNLAVRGKLVTQAESDEQASKLLNRFARAKIENKAKTGDARIKSEPDASPDQLDIFLPSGWAVQSFENLFLFIDYRGNTPAKTNSGVPLITAKNVRAGFLNREPREYVAKTTFTTWMTRGFPRKGDLFFTTEAPLANVCLNDIEEPFALAQRVICFQPYAEIDTKFLMFALMSDVMQSLIDRHATGMTAKGIKAANLKPLPIPIPPLAEQHRIVAKVDALMSLCDRLEAALTAADSARARLLDALLAEALATADDSSGATTVEPAAKVAWPGAAVTTERSAFVLALAYERHRSARRDRTFGHVKAEKILHLIEAEAGLDLRRAPIRDAAGPNDFPHLLGVDRWAKQHRRFAFDERGKGYTFEPLADFQRSLQMAESIDVPTRARIETIIALFVPMDTEDAELFATVYAAWNNLLIEGKRPKDEDILRAAREDWHPKKLQIPREKFVAALQRVKASAFVPSGRGKSVPPALQRDLFSRQ